MRVEDGAGREHGRGDSRNEFNRFVPLFRIKRLEKSLESNINDTDERTRRAIIIELLHKNYIFSMFYIIVLNLYSSNF